MNRAAPIAGIEFAVKGVTWHARAADAELLRDWLEAHFPAILGDEICLLKKDRGRRVALAEGLVLKETTRRHDRSALRFGLRRSTSRFAFVAADRLRAGGVPVPRALAWATVRRRGLRAADYIITEQIAGARQLTYILKAAADHAALRRPVAEGLGALMGLFHRNGYSNRDLKDGNVLVSEEGGLRMWAVDFDGVCRAFWRVGGLKRDFRAIVHSLALYGWAMEEDLAALRDSYNERVSVTLRLRRVPDFGFVARGRIG